MRFSYALDPIPSLGQFSLSPVCPSPCKKHHGIPEPSPRVVDKLLPFSFFPIDHQGRGVASVGTSLISRLLSELLTTQLY